jgi:hypothetical protein
VKTPQPQAQAKTSFEKSANKRSAAKKYFLENFIIK